MNTFDEYFIDTLRLVAQEIAEEVEEPKDPEEKDVITEINHPTEMTNAREAVVEASESELMQVRELNAKVVINMGLYMHIEAEVPIEVPAHLHSRELVEWLHTNYKGLLDKKEKRDAENADRILCANCGSVMEAKTFDGLCSEQCRKDMKYKLEQFKKPT
jgi:hypothetical protein